MSYLGVTPAPGLITIDQLDDTVKAEFRAGRKNKLINGNFDISQRGDFSVSTPTANDDYNVDRWRTYLSTVTAAIEHKSTAQPGGITDSKSVRVTATSTATGRVGILQVIEDFAELKGKTLTLTALVKANNTNARIGFYDGVTEQYSSAHSGGGAWEPLELTFSTSASTSIAQVILHAAGPTGGLVATNNGDYIEVARVQLEIGDTATEFEKVLVGTVLHRCKRYYEAMELNGGNSTTGEVTAGGGVEAPLVWEVEKRAIPTITLPPDGQNPGEISFLYQGNYPTTTGTHSVTEVGVSSARIVGSAGYVGLTPGQATVLNSNGITYIEVDAEL